MTVDATQLALIADELDLGLPDGATLEEFVASLQMRLLLQTASLAARLPDGIPTATGVRLRASQRREVELCVQALDLLGAPYTPEEEA